MMIGAASCLAMATSNSTYIDRVSNIVDFVIQNETADGVLVERHACGFTDMDCLEFDGITFRFLAKYMRANSALALRRPNDLVNVLRQSISSILRFSVLNSTAYPDTWIGPSPDPNGALSISSQTSGLIALLEWTNLVCQGYVE
jgi:predicted alpha-1,6-mannanase (GH76 family)